MDNEWPLKAKCRGTTPGIYALDEDPYRCHPHYRRIVAQWLCHGCPVIKECATDALRHNDRGLVRAGVWLRTGDPKANRRRLNEAINQNASKLQERKVYAA